MDNRAYVKSLLNSKSFTELISSGSYDRYPVALEMTNYLFEKYGEDEMLDFYLLKSHSSEEIRAKMMEYEEEFEEYLNEVEIPEGYAAEYGIGGAGE